MKTALVFPAFITDYSGKELDLLNHNGVSINDYLNKISDQINLKLPEFKYENDEYKNNELYSQLIAYVFSCAFADILKKNELSHHFTAGYSMGIYATLYSSGCISFIDGAKLIYNAFQLVNELAQTRKYSMGAIIGLTLYDIEHLAKKTHEVEVINVNNKHSQVIAGKKENVLLALSKAKEEGAISTTELTVNTPYHSKFLLPYSEKFAEYIDTMQIKECQIPIISTFDQRIITKVEDIKLELVFNLTQKINWYETMLSILDLGVSVIYEVGAGKDLKKISRFIEGEYTFKSIYNIKKEGI